MVDFFFEKPVLSILTVGNKSSYFNIKLVKEDNRIRNITLSVLNFTPSGHPIYQHVLMLDRESGRGLVRTQEKEFRSIEELIDHYLPKDRVLHLPSQSNFMSSIISSDTFKVGI